MEENLKELSNEELLKEAQKRKKLLSVYSGLIAVMVIAGIIITIGRGMNVYTFLPFVFLGVAGIYWSGYDKIRKEVKTRKLP